MSSKVFLTREAKASSGIVFISFAIPSGVEKNCWSSRISSNILSIITRACLQNKGYLLKKKQSITYKFIRVTLTLLWNEYYLMVNVLFSLEIHHRKLLLNIQLQKIFH